MTDGKLETVWVPIGSVTPHPRNVRQGDVGAIAESLKAHGQYRPVVVQRSTGHILAGNHTWKAAKALKCVQIAVTFLDCDDDEALRIMLTDNRTTDLASYDDTALAALLKQLDATAAGLHGTGYIADDIDDLMHILGDMMKEADGRSGDRTPRELICQECGAVVAR